MRRSRRLLAALAVVAVGRLLSPDAVPVYDGIGTPDEPYRYVAAPPGATKTAAPAGAHASSPLVGGRSSYGMSAATAESGPQFSLFVPPQALAAPGTTLRLDVAPKAPDDQPAKARIDGNVYEVTFTAAGPVTLTDKAALATLYMRATTPKQPPPVMQHRASASDPWEPLSTARGGRDVYVATFAGPGQYALAFATGSGSSDGGSSPLPWVVGGGVLLLLVVVVVVRLRASS